MILETAPTPKTLVKRGQQPQVRTLFCDFDGPLVDVSDRYYHTYQLALANTFDYYREKGQPLYLTPLDKAQFWQMKQQRISDEQIASCSGLQDEHISYFLQQVSGIVNDCSLLEKDKFHQGVHWALALLHSQGVQLVLVTLRCQDQVRQILTNYGLLRLFQGVYGTSDETAAYGNNIECKTGLLKQALQEQADGKGVMVGDTEADILAAKAVGMPAIALTCGIRSFEYLQQFEPDYICHDLLSTAYHLLWTSNPTAN